MAAISFPILDSTLAKIRQGLNPIEIEFSIKKLKKIQQKFKTKP